MGVKTNDTRRKKYYENIMKFKKKNKKQKSQKRKKSLKVIPVRKSRPEDYCLRDEKK